MKEIIIPELEEEIKKLPKQYVDSESVCKRYPLRYYEVKVLARSCNSFRMIRQRGVIDLVKFEFFIRSQFYEEGEEPMRRLEEDNPELASAVNSGSKKYVRYGKQAEQFSYVNIPKALIREEAFSDVSLEAKMLYGLILERMGMYKKNNWQDEDGRVYVVYPVKEIMEDMSRSENSVTKYMTELEDAGLLERKIRNGGKPTQLYLKRLNYVYEG